MHGVEPFDSDMTANKEGEAWIAHNNKSMLKGLKNLNKVPKHGCLASVGFMKSLGGTGAFARVVAVCPEIHMKSTVEVGLEGSDSKSNVLSTLVSNMLSSRRFAPLLRSSQFGEKVNDHLKTKEYPLRRDDNGVLRVSLDAEPTNYCQAAGSLGCGADGKGVWEE